MNLTKNHKKRHVLVRLPSEKFKYLKNGTIFFEKVDVEIHQTRPSITYLKTNEIGYHRLSRVSHNLRRQARINKYIR